MPLELPLGWVSTPAPNGLGLTAKWEAVKDARLPAEYSAPNSDEAHKIARKAIQYLQEPAHADNWQKPADTLALGTGDCEDWCLFIRALLINGGIDPENLWLLIVYDVAVMCDHALLWTPIRYCDVRAPRTLPHHVFSDYRPTLAFRSFTDGSSEIVTFGRRRKK